MTAVHAVIENVSRRGFLKGIIATGSLVIAAEFLPARGALAAYATGADKMPHGVRSDPHLFVSIAPDGTVTIVAIRSEMGTGSRTSLPMIVADEMDADWSRVRVVQAPVLKKAAKPSAVVKPAPAKNEEPPPENRLSAALARMETRILFEEMLARYPDYAVVGEPKWIASSLVRGVETMPVEWAGA